MNEKMKSYTHVALVLDASGSPRPLFPPHVGVTQGGRQYGIMHHN